MDVFDMLRMGSQAIQQSIEALPQIGEPLVATFVLGAIAQQEIERSLSVSSHIERQPHVSGRNAIYDYGAGIGSMAARIDDGRARAIGAAIKIDLGITKVLADIVQVVHGDGGCIFR